MIGRAELSNPLPAGVVVEFDSRRNALIVYQKQEHGTRVYVLVMPFVVPSLAADPEVELTIMALREMGR